METLIPVIVGVALLTVFVAVFFARDVWRAYHIAIVVLLAIAGVSFFVLSARTLRTHQSYRTIVNRLEAEIEQVEQQNRNLVEGVEGDPVQPGIVRLKAETARLLAGRGRVWENGSATAVDEATGVVTLTFEDAAPAFEGRKVVYAFDTREVTEGGQYMGEYLVASAGEKELQLTPVTPLDNRQLERLYEGPWTLYEVMPVDNYEVYENLDPDTLAGILPEASREEFLLHGKAPTEDTLPQLTWSRLKFLKDFPEGDQEMKFAAGATTVVDPKTAEELMAQGVAEEVEKVYVRPLRNYAQLFVELRRQYDSLVASAAAIQTETQEIAAAQAKIARDIEYREKEIVALKTDRDQFVKEKQVIERVLASIESRYRELLTQANTTFKRNITLVIELAETQRNAVDAVERRVSEQISQAGAPAVQ